MSPIAIFLYSKSKIMAQPWADAGYECHLFDSKLQDGREGNFVFHGGDVRAKRKELGTLCRTNNPIFLGSFTPCDDMATCGSKHFEKKFLKDAYFWAKSLELAMIGIDLAEYFGIPYFVENPRSMLSTLWRKPDFKFDPCMFGGYLPENHEHKLFPEIYPPRDAYNKETWIWVGNGLAIPEFIPVVPVSKDYPGWKKLGGKSERTKEIRSCTPEGFAKALFIAQMKKLVA